MNEQDVKLLEGPSTSEVRPLAVAAARVDREHEAPDLDPSGPDVPGNPLLKIHQLLRGRYTGAIALAIVLGALGVLAGYRLTTPKFRSTGLLRVRPALPRVMFQTEQNSVMPAYEAFVNEQVALMTSPRVLDAVFEMPAWRASGLQMSPEAFKRALTVEYPRGQQYIVISFSSPDPETARVAVVAMMAAYRQVYEETDVDGRRQRQGLEERRRHLTSELARLESVVSTLAPFGPAAVQESYDYKLSELNKLESEMRRIEIAIASSSPAGAGKRAGPASRPVAVTPAEAAEFDADVRRMLEEKRSAESNLHRLKLRFGSAYPQVRDAQSHVTFLERCIAERVERIRDDLPITGSVGDQDKVNPEALRQQLKNLTALHERTRKGAAELADLGTRVRTASTQAEAARTALTETNARIESLDVESSVGGRIGVLSEPSRPSVPERDRRKKLAAAGGAAGMGAGVGLVLLAGLVNRRLRYAADASAGLGQSLRVLGVLPALPQKVPSDLHISSAARSLHKIRALLQIHSRTTGGRVFAVTSPSPGAGKTSLTVALGLSFAASGSRTLLIDCDIVGEGLSNKLVNGKTPRSKLGRVLVRAGLLRERQLAEALRVAKQQGWRLGEAALELGYLTEEDVQRALLMQQQSKAGVLDVLAGEPLRNCLTETGIPGLRVLPSATFEARHASQLAPAAVDRMMNEARRAFDVVLVDTGPIPASVEASVVASQADQVILIVARGEAWEAAERAVKYLGIAGAQVAGVVFNRARLDDAGLLDYGKDSGVYALSPRRGSNGNGTGRGLGPVAAALQSFDGWVRRTGSA